VEEEKLKAESDVDSQQDYRQVSPGEICLESCFYICKGHSLSAAQPKVHECPYLMLSQHK
jgi:hypothetical protein